LLLYRNTGIYREQGSQAGGGNDFEFVRELSTVQVNTEGWARYSFTVPSDLTATAAPGDPDYCVVTLPELMEPDCQPGTTFSFRLAT
jgi:hypothetical protein